MPITMTADAAVKVVLPSLFFGGFCHMLRAGCYKIAYFYPCLYYKIKKMREIMLFFKEKTLYLRVFKRNKINHNKN